MEQDPFGRTARRTTLACTLLAIAVIQVLVGAAALAVSGIGWSQAVHYDLIISLAIGLTFPVCGTLIALHRPRNPIGWLLIAYGLGHAASGLAAGLLAAGAASWSPAVLRPLSTVNRYAWAVGSSTVLSFAFYLFPDGRLPSPRWRVVVIASLITAPLDIVVWGAIGWGWNPGPGTEPALLPVPSSWMPALHTTTDVKSMLAAIATLVALSVRYRRGEERERQQLLWVLMASVLQIPLLVPTYLGVPYGGYGMLVQPVAIAVAILRHNLLDIRFMVSRAVLYGLLTGAVIAAYLGLVTLGNVVWKRQLDRPPGLAGSALVTLVIAVAFNPVRRRLQALVEGMLYGDRANPVRVVSRIGDRLAGTGLGDVPEAVCEALRVPYAAVVTTDGDASSHWGASSGRATTLLLEYHGRTVGTLVIGLRPGELRLSAADTVVLELLAVPLATALHATVLTRQLQHSRERIVAAREEERRRIRRDLHDGLGPALAGAAFQADAARNLIALAPHRAADLLADLRGQISSAVQEIRRLVDGLRPPALDQLGLIGALRERSAQLAWRPDGQSLDIRLEAPRRLPPLPAAVEVAAYRIAAEALTNAARHSHATRVCLQIKVGDQLRLVVTDDGKPLQEQTRWQPGVGLSSMCERAAELGGSCAAGPDPAGHGTVIAVLPLSRPT
ncbi:sensor histidine kinase [Streptomyces sp. NPDC059517]|uniref:sensor histidine kinase n=1 Tax=Streptomyces sp. NPDC059517 TaxID=3346855 RepID=UPI00368FD4AC